MGRLIDADDLYEKLKKDSSYDLDFFDSELREIIEKQPTAYDVENVVEALEEQQEYYSFDLDNDLDCAKYKAYKNAIDIVKRGGVDNEYKG